MPADRLHRLHGGVRHGLSIIAGDDEAVVLEQHDVGRGPAGPLLETPSRLGDRASERQTWVDIFDPQSSVAEQLLGKAGAVSSTAHSVDDGRVRMEDESPRNECVEEALH